MDGTGGRAVLLDPSGRARTRASTESRCERSGQLHPVESQPCGLLRGEGSAAEDRAHLVTLQPEGGLGFTGFAVDVIIVRPAFFTYLCVSNILFFVFFCCGGQISQISSNCSQTSCLGAT